VRRRLDALCQHDRAGSLCLRHDGVDDARRVHGRAGLDQGKVQLDDLGRQQRHQSQRSQ